MKTIELKRTNGEVIFSHEEKNNSLERTLEVYIEKCKRENKFVDLRNTVLRASYLNGIDLSGAELNGTDLSYTDLTEANLNGADLSDAILRSTDLSGADLSRANLSDAILRGADLSDADLSCANLSDAILRDADLSGADLSDAILRSTDLSGADLRSTDLSGADLSFAKLRGANLSGADLNYAKLRGADLSNIKTDNTTQFFELQCPSEGSFIGYKKTYSINKANFEKLIKVPYIVKLEIPADAKRSSATTYKCRCSKAKVLAIENLDGTKADLDEVYSGYDNSFKYKVGEIVEVDDFDEDRWNECTRGIHFFMNREQAVNY